MQRHGRLIDTEAWRWRRARGDGRSPSRVRRPALVAVLALVAGVLGIAGVAQANDGGRWQVVTITFGVEGYDFPGREEQCDPGAPANCVVIVTEPGFTLTGDLAGTGTEARVAVEAPTGISIIRGLGTFAGVVKACGSGTFVYSLSIRFDANTNTLRGGEYIISPGTGTGDLEGITGTFDAGTGPVRCHRH